MPVLGVFFRILGSTGAFQQIKTVRICELIGMRMQSTATAGLGSHMRTPCPDHQEIMGCVGLLPRRGWGSALGQPVGCVPANMRAVAGYPSPGACQGLSFDVRPTHPCCACHQTNSDAELVRMCDPLGCSGARCMPADMQAGMAGMYASIASIVLGIAHGYLNTRPHIGIAGWVYPNSARQRTRGDMGTGRSTPKSAPRGRKYQCTPERAGYSKPKRVCICELNAPRLLQRQGFLVEWLSCLGVRWCLGCSLRCTKSSSSHEPLPADPKGPGLPRSMDSTCHG